MFSIINNMINRDSLVKLINFIKPNLAKLAIYIDSRLIKNGGIFCAYQGSNSNGNEYIKDIIKNVDIILTDNQYYQNDLKVIYYYINNLQHYVGLLASIKYNQPSLKTKVIGVTGTNGKTSVTNWLAQFYYICQRNAAVIGTLGAGIYGNLQIFNKTTPDPIYLQNILNEFVINNVDRVLMEVSSHSLDQGRVNGTYFDTAIFTNLTEDHLDYHKTMENYFQAKKQLFYWQDLKNIVINLDDKYGKKLYNNLLFDKLSSKIITYSINIEADLMAKDINISISGSTFTLVYQNQDYYVKMNLIGLFNIYNMLAAIATLILDNYTIKEIISIIPQLKSVNGRMDTIKYKKQPLIVIDYAHTPDALENVLLTLKQLSDINKLICVFGCGGNRDKQKRPIMAKIAENIADDVIITSDNPRDEDPLTIIDDIRTGFSPLNKSFMIIENRKQAIIHSINMAGPKDVILIAGKGHEQYQEIKGIKYNFSDFDVIHELLGKD